MRSRPLIISAPCFTWFTLSTPQCCRFLRLTRTRARRKPPYRPWNWRALTSRRWLQTCCTARTCVEVGIVGEKLCAMIEREHIDLAVVGTHGRTGLKRLFMGSVAEEVFRHAPCPVLTVGPHSWRSDPQSVHLKHILFSTDLSPDSARALPFVLDLAADFGARVTLLHVVEVLDGEAAHDRRRVIAALEDRMRDLATAERPLSPDLDFLVELGEVAETVIDVASRLRVDLVAFGLKAPDSFVDRLPWMNAYKIVCEVACPVLSLRGPSGQP